MIMLQNYLFSFIRICIFNKINYLCTRIRYRGTCSTPFNKTRQ